MKTFFDSNILIYTLARNDPRQATAATLLAKGGNVSVQVLNEVASVAHRKLKMPWSNVRSTLLSFQRLVDPPLPLTPDLHTSALGIAESYGVAFYDAMIIAAALKTKSEVLLSEDMQDGLSVDGRLTIRNPFQSI